MNRSITDDLLALIRRQFYQGKDKEFYQQQDQLLQAVTYPAWWLSERGFSYPEGQYFDLVREILRTIALNGNVEQVRFFCRYLLTCVQEHMKHHGEEYLERAKGLQSVVDSVLHGLRKMAVPAEAQQLGQVAAMAEAHRVLLATKKTRKKQVAKPTEQQQSLF